MSAAKIDPLALVALFALPLACLADDDPFGYHKEPPIVGRWDITVHGPKGDYPSWLEVTQSGYRTLVGSFVGRTGSARPISKVVSHDGQIEFSLPPQYERRTDDMVFRAKIDQDTLQGDTTDETGRRITFEATRAPSLARSSQPSWAKPEPLFNGNNLAGWHPRNPKIAHGWEVRDGHLTNTRPGNDLVSDRTFDDFELHAEFRYPKGSNSGIYLRGRYELQIEDNFGDEPESHKIGGIYGFLTPSLNASKPSGEWQSVDVMLVGRTLSVILNGERIIDRQRIPGPTGGALDSHEAKPGPIMLQGDHGPVEFRKLTIASALPSTSR